MSLVAKIYPVAEWQQADHLVDLPIVSDLTAELSLDRQIGQIHPINQSPSDGWYGEK